MKRIVFGIFAHPDDEAFGPSGTLLQATKDGAELHLLLLTRGENGTNPDNHADLGEVRHREWSQSARLLGAHATYCLDYIDGQLNNQAMVEIGQQIIRYVQSVLDRSPKEANVDFITFDVNGITGHLDHIVAARATAFAFYTLKKEDARIARLFLTCLSSTNTPTSNIDWLYMEAGRLPNEIDLTCDCRHLRQELEAIIHTHHTQRQDAKALLERAGDQLGVDHFVVLE